MHINTTHTKLQIFSHVKVLMDNIEAINSEDYKVTVIKSEKAMKGKIALKLNLDRDKNLIAQLVNGERKLNQAEAITLIGSIYN